MAGWWSGGGEVGEHRGIAVGLLDVQAALEGGRSRLSM
jgi:hypothetical protein